MEDLDELIDRLKARSDNAYCRMIEQARRDECLGWEIKAERGKFGRAELTAHTDCAESLGKHRAYFDAWQMLRELRDAQLPQRQEDPK